MGKFIADSLIEDIRNQADIVDIIGSRLHLKKSGANYLAVCPFHQEKTPSFSVSPSKQIYHCFGCGVGGNVFHFLMRKDGLTFSEAVHYVAERYNIVVPHSGPAGKKSLGKKELLVMHERFAHHYHSVLMNSKEGENARAYLKNRGINLDMAKEFLLGFVPANESSQVTSAITASMPGAIVEQAGLYNKGSRGLYNRFSGRLLFPIQDYQGKVIGFGGRSMSEGQQPKYLNSPETVLYHKSNILYNLHRAREVIRETGTFLIVEGYLDLISTYMAGFKAVVAPLGTALTSNQVRLLKRFTTKACLIFDADEAGLKASMRGVETIIMQEMNPTVACLPRGEDPDSFIKSRGSEEFALQIEKAFDEVDFFHYYSVQKHDLTQAKERIEAISSLMPIINKQPNKLRRDEYIRRLSDIFGLDESALRSELKKSSSRSFKPAQAGADNSLTRKPGVEFPGERDIVQLLLLFPDIIRPLLQKSEVIEHFADDRWKTFIEYIMEQPDTLLANPAEFLGSIEANDLREKASALLLVEDKKALWENPETAFDDLVIEKKKRHNVQRLREIHQKLKTLNDSDEIDELFLEIDRLKKENLLLLRNNIT